MLSCYSLIFPVSTTALQEVHIPQHAEYVRREPVITTQA